LGKYIKDGYDNEAAELAWKLASKPAPKLIQLKSNTLDTKEKEDKLQ